MERTADREPWARRFVSGPWAVADRSTWLRSALLVAVVARIAAAVRAAALTPNGDFRATLPGGYVRTLNPILWNSPDLQTRWAFHLDTYLHGPVQYLTLYPIAFLDSYRQIAIVLLPIYAVVLAAALWCLRRTCAALAPGQSIAVPLLASTFLFFPLLQAYIQREFEVVVVLALALALWFLVRDKRGMAAAMLAYAAWFKYLPLLFGVYLAIRGWFRAVAVFVVTSAAILGLAHLLFGLPQFFNNNVPRHALRLFTLSTRGFCADWIGANATLASVRNALCGAQARAPWFPANAAYLILCGGIAVVYLAGHRQLARQDLSRETEAWRRALELSIFTTVCACFFFAHYYYLAVLVIPLNVLLTRYLAAHATRRLCAWGLAYFSLSAFVVPTGLLTRALGTDVWAFFMSHGVYVYGELLLIALLLREYWDLAAHGESSAATRLGPAL
jgi:hypothetical protein